MLELDSALAQHIVDRAMAILPHNINVMDAQGMIIGSGDPARLHTRHEGAQLVLANRRVVEIDEQAAACSSISTTRRLASTSCAPSWRVCSRAGSPLPMIMPCASITLMLCGRMAMARSTMCCARAESSSSMQQAWHQGARRSRSQASPCRR